MRIVNQPHTPERLRNKYIIEAKAQYGDYPVYLQDQTIDSGGFWTRFVENAVTYASKEGALGRLFSIRHGKPRVLYVDFNGKLTELSRVDGELIETPPVDPAEGQMREHIQRIVERNQKADQTLYISHSDFNHSNMAGHDIVWLTHMLEGLLDGKTPQQLVDEAE